jgi:alcohol dehydrogenase class IV
MEMEWLIFTSQLPTTPSSLRVMVWRRMKSMGALSLQNGVWLLPHTEGNKIFLNELMAYLKEQDAGRQAFVATALDAEIEREMIERFNDQRREEYAEFIERCRDMLRELQKETEKGKFTFAELEENEDDLDKLETWLDKIKKRDHFENEPLEEAGKQIEACRSAFKTFAEQVYQREGITQP